MIITILYKHAWLHWQTNVYVYGCDIFLFREQYIQGKILYLGTYIVSSSDVLIIRSVSLSTISCHYNIINHFFDCHNY